LGGNVKKFLLVLLMVLAPGLALAQSTPFDAPFHPLPTADERKVANIASWGTVLADVALDAKASWDSPNRGRAFAMQGIRTVVTIGVDYEVKSLVGRQRPCAPSDCGIDSPNSSFYSMHTALAFSTLGGPRLSVSLPLAIGTGGLRVAAGKHYLTDVLVGMAAGAITSRIR
jgi:membrane-associated phospholipid phosphatase